MHRPVVLTLALDSSFPDYTSGVWNYSGPAVGYHAMCIVGYDDAQGAGAFKVRNSWSAAGARAGYVWIGYQTFLPALPVHRVRDCARRLRLRRGAALFRQWAPRP